MWKWSLVFTRKWFDARVEHAFIDCAAFLHHATRALIREEWICDDGARWGWRWNCVCVCACVFVYTSKWMQKKWYQWFAYMKEDKVYTYFNLCEILFVHHLIAIQMQCQIYIYIIIVCLHMIDYDFAIKYNNHCNLET